jgi:hypothetical protein
LCRLPVLLRESGASWEEEKKGLLHEECPKVETATVVLHWVGDG